MREALAQIKSMLKRGDLIEAEREAQQFLTQVESAEALYLLAVAKRYLQKHSEAVSALHRLLLVKPDFASAYQELGHNYRAMKRAKEASEAYKQALERNDMLLASWDGLVDLLRQQGLMVEARDAEIKMAAIQELPSALAAVANLINEGSMQKAERECRAYLNKIPGDVNGIRLLAKIAVKLNALDDAETLLRKCTELAPDFISANTDLLLVYQKRHKYADALVLSERLLAKQPDNLSILSLHARALGLVGRYPEAIEVYRKMIKLGASNAMVLMSLGHALKTVGDTDAAVSAYREAYKLKPDFGDAYWSLANLKTFQFSDQEISEMESIRESAVLGADDRVHFCFALGKAYEDQGNYDTSFFYYEMGNELKKQSIGYNPQKTAREMQAQIDFFDRAFFQEKHNIGYPTEEPIFIVGLPRAGSTLLEQILASHPDVEGTKELPNIIALVNNFKRSMRKTNKPYPEFLTECSAYDLYKAGEKYIQDTRIQRKGALRFIDKMPNNFRHIGFIKTILPNAKIIDARRDPLSCCFSNYKQLFADGQKFSYGLEDLAAYYKDYVRLMDHWDWLLPGQILRVQYEDVVVDLENQVRRILAFCGLEFTSACLDFHKTARSIRTASSEQVRQPIYNKSLEIWRPYKNHLKPLFAAFS
jgi:tetratricopeptide (TPR) repeat protein